MRLYPRLHRSPLLLHTPSYTHAWAFPEVALRDARGVVDGVDTQADVHRPSIDKAVVSGYLLPDYCREATHTHPVDSIDGAIHVNLTHLGDDDGSSELSPGGDSSSGVYDGLCVNPDFEAGMLTFGEQELEQVRACVGALLWSVSFAVRWGFAL